MYVGLFHLGSNYIMNGKGKIHKRNRLHDQPNSGCKTGKVAETNQPRSGLNHPEENHTEDNKHDDEDSEEHMVGNRPSKCKQEQRGEGTSERTGCTIHELDTMSTKNHIQISIKKLIVTFGPMNIL